MVRNLSIGSGGVTGVGGAPGVGWSVWVEACDVWGPVVLGPRAGGFNGAAGRVRSLV